MSTDNSKVLVAMSGGVDSSAAAALLIDEGYDCIGCTMRFFDKETDDSDPQSCCSLADVNDAREVCDLLGIPHHVFDFRDEFKKSVIDDFISVYETGRTPNPCIECNRLMKFGRLYSIAEELGCKYIATGHYARITVSGEEYFLNKALDFSKDQSYVLYFLNQEQLAHTLFPLGSLTKEEVRIFAERRGFTNAGKRDSQDICFIPDGNRVAFFERYTGRNSQSGVITDGSGKLLGKHKGLIRYTVGQHKNLGIISEIPLYVTALDAKNNTLTVGTKEELLKNICLVSEFNWISGKSPENELSCSVRLRYRQPETEAFVYTDEKGVVHIETSEPRVVCPGQSAVLYDGNTVLGGGKIMG
ncbi:MAG: tRNA 2-thiouridine(34) synthase MnmA [Clostridiales bacterium]|jgi:tRNA-specific 2-thiouridylase|nr:tRNA 2-thiouridine(34) synthase MnmA [Clostridiales bacterium]